MAGLVFLLGFYKQKQTRDTRVFCHSLCGPICMIFDGPKIQHGELFLHRRTFFFWQKKISEFTKRNFGCEFGNFFLPNKKMSYGVKKVRHVGFQVHQKSSKSARIGSGKKMLKLGTPIEISTKRQQNQAICGSGLVHACLDSSEEIDCPSSNDHNFRSFASIGLIFCLNRSRIRRTFRKTKPQRAFCAPGGAVLCRLPSVSCLFLLVGAGGRLPKARRERVYCAIRSSHRPVIKSARGTP